MTGSSLKRLPCTLESPPLFFCASTVTCSAKSAPAELMYDGQILDPAVRSKLLCTMCRRQSFSAWT